MAKENIAVGNKIIAYTLSFCLLLSLFPPTLINAQDSGPSGSVSSGSSSSGGGYNVDPFTGDFSYSIPLVQIGGYPLTIHYNPNISMETEASWVGLGWNLNVGSIDREKRGLPDDFKGDEVSRTLSQKPDITVGKAKGSDVSASAGVSAGLGAGDDNSSISVFGGIGLKLSGMLGFYVNSYRGIGYTAEKSFNATLFGGFSLAGAVSGVGGVTGGFGYSEDNQNGIGTNFTGGAFGSLNMLNQTLTGGSSVNSTSYSSRSGIENKTYTRSTTFFNNTSTNRITKSFGVKAFLPKLGYDAFNTNYVSIKGRGAYLNASFTVGVGVSLGLEINDMKKKYKFQGSQNIYMDDSKAYGYFHLDQADGDSTAVLDFNREKEQVLTEETPMLPVTVPTFDLFRVNNGLYSATFRAHRSEVGTFTDPMNRSLTQSNDTLDIESYGTWYKETKGQPRTITNKQSGRYLSELTSPGVNNHFKFRTGFSGEEYEKYYFKKVGEITPTNMELWDDYGGNYAAALGIEFNSSQEFNFTSQMVSNNGSFGYPTNNIMDTRETRRDYFKVYTPEDIQRRSWNSKIKNFNTLDDISDDYMSVGYSEINRDDSYRKDHHISRIDVIDGTGMQYNYGVPVYSIKEEHVSFSVSDGFQSDYSSINSSGVIAYYPGASNPDNSTDNQRGERNSFQKITTPAYATTQLLDEILSPDYIDKTGNGVSPDDMGNYVKFNYTNYYGDGDPYKWRLPYSQGSGNAYAYYHEGIEGDPYDDQASYIYGEKEVWYPQSIVTKNYVVEFYLKDRKDAFSVNGENGVYNFNKPLQKLDKIVVYALEDRMENGTNATPLKTIEFVYDYSLCKNFPMNKDHINGTSSDDGKLTLKSISISTGTSEAKKISMYEFKYGANINYDRMSSDKWTNFKNNDPNFPNRKYPYADQDESNANQYAKYWKLSEITTPTDKVISIDYEADKYSHVQDQRAMKFFNVVGTNSLTNHFLYNTFDSYNDPGDVPVCDHLLRDLANLDEPHEVLYFELDEDINRIKSVADEIFRKDYLGYNHPDVGQPIGSPTNELHFKFDVGMRNSNDMDQVKGFSKVLSAGVVGVAPPFKYGYIILKKNDQANQVCRKKNKCYFMSPIQKTALQHMRLNTSYKIFANELPPTSTGEPMYLYHTAYDKELTKKKGEFFLHVLNENAFCISFDTEDSWIRLYDPDNKKIGGNYRVKSITVKDGWNAMTGESESEYTTEYIYSNEAGDDDVGVASYLPQMGKDESPFYLPKAYIQENKYHPDDHHYQLLPYGESYFGAPVVGYPKVTVKRSDITDVTQHTTGKKVYEFLTSRDHPYRTSYVEKDTSLVDIYDKDNGEGAYKLFASQGYFVEVNDFHGKPEVVTTLNRDGAEISKTKYEYYGLYDQQPVINEDGQISNQFLGKEYDIVVDQIANRMISKEEGLIESFEVSLIPVPSWDEAELYSRFQQEMRGVVMTKSINHYAIPKKVESTYLGNKSTFIVDAYDQYSGNNIVSNVPNEYEYSSDRVHDISLPAHWKYERLKPKYVNDGYYEIDLGGSNTIDASGELTGVDASYFNEGDWVEIDNGSSKLLYHVIKDAGDIFLIDEDGEYLDGSQTAYQVHILESGFENRSVETMAFYKTHRDTPLSGAVLDIDYEKIISASAMEYGYNDALICQDVYRCGDEASSCGYEMGSGNNINPFIAGYRSTLRPVKSYAFQTNLQNDQVATATDIRNDGKLKDFVPFYEIAGGNWYNILESSHPDYDGTLQLWRQMGEISRWDENGRVVDSKNQIGVHYSTLYGYNGNLKLLPVATASNAELRQMGFDGIEDYNFKRNEVVCDDYDHFSFRESLDPGRVEVSEEEKHTGIYSLLVKGGYIARINRIVNECETKGGKEPIYDKGGFTPVDCNCIEKFSPTEGEYLASIWVKIPAQDDEENYNPTLTITIQDGSGSTNYNFSPVSPIIDGWQKFETEYTVPSDVECFIFTGSHNTEDIYLDDFRTHPFNSSMNTMVYHPFTLLPMASHDSYNYSTFFQYDNAYNRVGLKIETVEGIHSVNENRNGLVK